MVKVIRTNGKEWSEVIKQPFAKGLPYHDQNELLIGHFSKLLLFKVEIKDSVEATYELKINFLNSKTEMPHARYFSNSGMFVSTYDLDVHHTKQDTSSINVHKWYQNIKLNDKNGKFEETGHTISLPDWKWGREAAVEFESEKRNKNFEICLALRPFIILGSPTEMQFTLIEKSKKTGNKKVELTMICEFDEDLGNDDSSDNLYQMIKEFGSLKIDGMGASIHPKQLVTVKLLKYVFEKKIKLKPKKKKMLKIAYFGPDSTENLRSVMRLINGMENLNVMLYLVVHPEWDIYSAVVPFNNTDYQLKSGNNIKFKKIDLSKKYYSKYGAQMDAPIFNDDEFGIDEAKHIPEMDVVISTYVAPWTLFNKDNNSKLVYEECLRDLLGLNTFLITIDPTEASDIVISSGNVGFKNNSFINEFYVSNLKLKNIVYPYHIKSFVQGTIWTLRDGVKE